MINRDRNDAWHWTIVRALVLALLAAGSFGAPVGGVAHAQQPPSEVGQWEILPTTVFGHFEIVLPTGKVLLWGLGNPENRGTLWDPADGSFTANPAPRNTRCSGFCQLPDGRSLLAGGLTTNEVDIFDPFTLDPVTLDEVGSWIPAPDMSQIRFYPTCTSLPDGRALIMGGRSDIPEVYDPIANAWQQLNAAPLSLPTYPRMFVLPSGLVFLAGEPGGMSWTFDVATDTWEQVGGNLLGFNDTPAVALEPGKILISGGGNRAGTNGAAIIDFNQPDPNWRLIAPMNFPRSTHNATVLPDGKVLVAGGRTGDGVLTAEMFDPVNETWTMMADMLAVRGPHSTALLLPNGQVLSRRDDSPDLQIYSPPYLFNGARPSILMPPDSIEYGVSFPVGTNVGPNSIVSVALIRPSDTTHSLDMGQLYVPLGFTASGGALNVTAPADANLAPPGYYMLFIVNDQGVPSVAPFVWVGPAPTCFGDPDCQDGLFCNGAETCHLLFGCQAAGTGPCLPGQLCDDVGDVCFDCLLDLDCEDEFFCNGAETCDSVLGCQAAVTDPCPPGQLCDEVGDVCFDCVLNLDCDDGLFCNGAETCDSVLGCQAATDPCPLLCSEDHNSCFDCFVNLDCDDGLFCNGAETCSNQFCVGGAAPSCDDGSVCTDDSCGAGDSCVNTNNAAPCDDLDACTTADTCAGGACVGGAAPNCDDSNVCTDDSCDSAIGCVTANNTASCDDASACTTAETCAGGVCVDPAAPDCQTHTTDFSKSDSPNGLSRRGYKSGTGGTGYSHAHTDWHQQFWGGAYRILSSNSNRFISVDYGTGLGGDVLPAPLVQGGAFSVNPLPGFQPGHGPYAVPFDFRADFVSGDHFVNAPIYTGPDVPSVFPSNPNWKSCGVTLEVVNLESATEVVRQVTLGAFKWDTATPMQFVIYDNGFPPMSGGSTPQISDPSEPWKLKVSVSADHLSLFAAFDGTPLGGPPVAVSTEAAPGVPWNVQRVRSAALRIAGVVPTQAIEISQVEIASPNIPLYDGTPQPTTLLPSGQPLVRREGADILRQGPFGAVGVNSPDLLNIFAGFDATPEYGEHVLDQLASRSQLRIVRFSTGGVFSKYVKDVGSPGWPRANYPLMELFESDPASYFAAFDRLVNAATARGVLLVPVLVWGPHNPYSHANGVPKATVTAGQVKGTFGLPGGDTGSDIDAARDSMTDFVKAVAEHYAGHPTIAFWEVGNEWDNRINRTLNPLSFGTTPGCWIPTWIEFWDSPAGCATAQDFVASLIRDALPAGGGDTDHLIGSGYHGRAASFLEDLGGGIYGPPSPTSFLTAMQAYYAESIDLVSVHSYIRNPSATPCGGPEPFSNWNDYMAFVDAAAEMLHPSSTDPSRAVYVGETNWKFNDPDPYDPVVWQAFLDAVSGKAVPGAGPRGQFAMLWEWMDTPHFDHAGDRIYYTEPADLTDTSHPIYKLDLVQLAEGCTTAETCDDGNVCTDDSCGPGGVCVNTNNTAPCDDLDACNGAETCSGGICVGGAAPSCDDGNVCTDDSCSPATGCVNTDNTASCEDGSVCTTADSCSGGVCVGGAAPNCDDGNVCTDDSCSPATGCVNTDSTASCDDGSACTTADTCAEGFCVGGAPPNCDDTNVCTDDSCNPATGCVNADNTVPCEDELFCNGAETCVDGACQGSEPCPGQGCDEGTDSCLVGPAARLESGSVSVGGTRVTVGLTHTYVNAVVVASVQYSNNTVPVVTRVSNVTAASFDIRLQNPSGGAVSPENVSYLVVEEGVWTVDGVKLEAQTYLSTVTDRSGSWVAEPQAYGQSYTNPVVLGQVMSENDPEWSVFWSRGSSRTNPPSAASLSTGKEVAEDLLVARADETIGFIVFEAAHGTIGGVAFEAGLGPDTVKGVDNGPPFSYAFNTPFGSSPQIAVVTMAGLDGGDGGWAQGHGAPLATATTLFLSIDEDQIRNPERGHTTEQLGYVVFESPVVFP